MFPQHFPPSLCTSCFLLLCIHSSLWCHCVSFFLAPVCQLFFKLLSLVSPVLSLSHPLCQFLPFPSFVVHSPGFRSLHSAYSGFILNCGTSRRHLLQEGNKTKKRWSSKKCHWCWLESYVNPVTSQPPTWSHTCTQPRHRQGIRSDFPWCAFWWEI